MRALRKKKTQALCSVCLCYMPVRTQDSRFTYNFNDEEKTTLHWVCAECKNGHTNQIENLFDARDDDDS